MATPFSSRFRHFFQKMTDDKHMNPDDQPLTDSTAEHAAGEQDFAADAAKYLRLAAEFENYKRRTAKERTDLFKTANQELMVALLPVIDDFDRARQHTQGTADPAALQNALDITYNKLTKTLEQKGLASMNAKGGDFDAELHEAITQIPAPSDDLRGKIVEEIEKGYYLGDKVIRHAKVILGQ
jgi:molecular chaperone GrpE